MNLDFMPSPAPDRPGLFIRDPYKFSDAMMIVPPVLVECLDCFDGQQTELDLRSALVRLTGEINVGDIAQNLVGTLSEAGFLENEVYLKMRDDRMRDFAAQPIREPAHAGGAYPADVGELNATMTRYMDGEAAPAEQDGLFAIAAPHVSPEGGWQSYRAAYSQLRPEHRDRTFVILATSHYGESERFGLTRKKFKTPLGEAINDTRLTDFLERRGGSAVSMEDYCHSFEHTIELQVIFLQHILGQDVRILPILCGPYGKSLYRGGNPEDDDGVRQFIDTLGELRDREGDRLFWVLGVDMAHMGARYQDRFTCRANEGVMNSVGERDQERMSRINSGDAAGFWDLVQENRDDLKWCGSSPFYTFLKVAPKSRGELLKYEQWNIDDRSVVSFAGMAFHK